MPSSTSRSSKKTSATRTTKKSAVKAAPQKTVKAVAAAKPVARPRTVARKAAVAATATPSPALVLSHDVIAQRAHDLYVQSGYQGHRQVEFWLEAERQLRDGAKF